MLDAGDRVGSLLFNDAEVVEIQPHRSRKRVMWILREVVRLNHALNVRADVTPEPGMLNEALRKVRRIATHDFLVAIISDFYGMDADTRRLIKLIGRHNDVIAAMVYDPSAAELPAGSRIIASDGDVQIEIDAERGRTRRDIASVFNDRLRTLKEDLSRLAIPVLPIETETPLDQQIRRLLGQRLADSRR